MRIPHLATGLALGLLAVLAPPAAPDSRAACAPAGADLDAVAAGRRAVESACACDGFASHRLYVDCAREVVAAEIAASRLSASCGHAVRRVARRSSCSHARPRVTCCRESVRDGRRTCVVAAPERCVSNGSSVRTACAATPFCADTRCDLKAPPPACGPELLYGPEGNRLRRYDLDTIAAPPLVDDVFIERASQGGLDINGQVCPMPDGSGRFLVGEDTGQPTNVAGFALIDAGGARVGKLVPTFQTELPGATSTNDPYGCAFDADGRLFTSDIGNNASGPGNGQLVLWFAPYDVFPGPPGTYPNTAHSTAFCKLATDIATAGGVAVDPQSRVYVTSARGAAVYRLSPPFPTSPDSAGGCGGTDALGSPVADAVQRETFIAGGGTLTGITRAANGNWFVASVITGTIGEYDPNGVLLRQVVAPLPGESVLPLSVGHPQGLAVDCRGDLFYADLDLRVGGGGIGPGPDGKVRRVPFDVCGVPGPNEIVKQGLSFPDGLGVLPGDLEGP